MEFHESKTVNFHAAIITSILPDIVNTPYRSYKVADAAMLVYDVLMRQGAAYRSLFRRARLVNVKAWRNGFSYGAMDTTQSPAVNQLVFTFAIGRQPYFPPSNQPFFVQSAISNRMCVYGTKDNRTQFISVALNSVECAALEFVNLQPRALRYIYGAVGAVLRSTLYRTHHEEFSRSYLADYHSTLYDYFSEELPLDKVLNAPYEQWPFFRSVWMRAPNLIATRAINPWTAAKALDVITPIRLRISYSDAAYDLVWGDGTNTSPTVASLVKSSILGLVAEDATSSDTRSMSSLLAPGLIYKLGTTGKPGLPKDLDLAFDLVTTLMSGEDVAKLLSPLEPNIRKLMIGDSAMAMKIRDMGLDWT